MLISVIITTYNSPDFLKQCLNSFLHQKDKNFELIVGDDGSTEDTKLLINQYKDSKIKLLHVWHEDQGFRAAKIRNEAVKLSSGEYLIFIDGDCVVFNDFIKSHREISEEKFFARGNRAMLSENFTQKLIKENVDINLVSFINIIRLRIKKDINRIFPILRFKNYPFRKINKRKWKGAKTCNLALWKKDFENINGFDESYIGWGREDSDLVVRLINNGIYRKEAIFSSGLVHLKHEINSRENISKNDKLLNNAVKTKKTYIRNGYKK